MPGCAEPILAFFFGGTLVKRLVPFRLHVVGSTAVGPPRLPPGRAAIFHRSCLVVELLIAAKKMQQLSLRHFWRNSTHITPETCCFLFLFSF